MYLSPFIPGLSTLTAPLHKLLKKDTDFLWNHTYDATFQQVKEASVSDTTLMYFNLSLPVTIHVNASQVGLGAALLQNGKPIAFTRKALTETECLYANIEREMLAAVFGADRFHTYIYGWSFTINSDHKPLESISQKNLADTPTQLQCMMLCLQGYNFTIHYHSGKEMVIPDMLSQFSPRPVPNLPLHIAIHHAHIMANHKEAFQQAFVNDPEMHTLADLIITGWPKDIKEIPHPLCPYWQHRETLTIEDGLVLWGEALIIPTAKRERVLHQLHQFHQGIMKSQLLVHGSFFWPCINKAIKEVVHQCQTCTWFQSQNAAAPITPTPTSLCPMADVCHCYLHARRSWLPGGCQFLLKDDLHSMSSTWPEQYQQGCLTTERVNLRAWHPGSPSLWQWPTICKCPVHWLLYILGYNTWNLKSALPAIQWICRGMHQVYQTCTPMSQIQQCWPTAHPASTLSYTHQHQASIPSGAIVPMPTQNNHSSQDTQQWPISHMSPWADWHMLRSHQITGQWHFLFLIYKRSIKSFSLILPKFYFSSDCQ